MAELTQGKRPLSTVFDLLGRDENDVTFAIGWLLRESPEFFRLFLAACGSRSTLHESVLVRLQRHEREEELAGITDIEIVSTDVHVVVEAKRGWELPAKAQLRKYVPRLRRSKTGDRRFVVLTRRSGSSARVMVEEALGRSLGGFPVVPVGLTDVTRITRQALRVERGARPRTFLRELLEYLEGAGYVQSHRDSRVLVVSLASGMSEIGIPHDQIPYERGFYWYGAHSPWPKEPPKYFGFRFHGRLQSIHHVDDTQPFGAFHEVVPGAKKKYDWGPGVLARLGPAIRPDHVVKTGTGLPFGRHAEVDIDLLLTCNSIQEALAKTKKRDRLAREQGLA